MKFFQKVLFYTISGYFIYEIIKYISSIDPQPTISELTRRHGYNIQTHYVTTKDGYILEHHRLIPAIKLQVSVEHRKVVVLNHGIMDKSNMWIAFSRERSLGYYLSERGYDVWILNTRGNSISHRHVSLSDEDSAYWEYSWHEIGIYDLPQSIDYILNVTHSSMVDFVGYSMGAASYFVMLSEDNSYSKKIRSMVALAPAVFYVDASEMIPYVNYLVKIIQKLLSLDIAYFGPRKINGYGCHNNDLLSMLTCRFVMACAFRVNDININQTEYRNAVIYIFGSTSGHSVTHYYQNYYSGTFRKYDHGEKNNLQVYGSLEPPEYDLTKTTTPVAVFWSDRDDVCKPKGIKKLITSLPNVALEHKVHGYSHASFFAAVNTKDIINERVHRFFNQQTPLLTEYYSQQKDKVCDSKTPEKEWKEGNFSFS